MFNFSKTIKILVKVVRSKINQTSQGSFTLIAITLCIFYIQYFVSNVHPNTDITVYQPGSNIQLSQRHVGSEYILQTQVFQYGLIR